MAKIWEHGERFVCLVTKDTGAELRPIADILARESGYDCYFNPQNPKTPHTFVEFMGQEAVGYLLMDLGAHDVTVPLQRVRTSGMCDREFYDELWCVCCIWVKPEHQRRGIGKELVILKTAAEDALGLRGGFESRCWV